MKKLLKAILWPFIYMGMKMIFPKFKNKNYYTLAILLSGVRQRLFGFNKAVPWPVHSSSLVTSSDKIKQGTKSPGISIGCFIDGRNGIELGENVWIGPRVSLISQNHDENNYYNYIDEGPIIIGKNSLLTANCVILPGVELGEHTIVAAGAVVTKSFKEGNVMLVGVPAKVVKTLNDYKA